MESPSKGTILTIKRSIDENWFEGDCGDRVGIFPKVSSGSGGHC
jgi:hypothetical protein